MNVKILNILQCRNILTSSLSRLTCVARLTRTGKSLVHQSENVVYLKRSVHYKPHKDEELDRKQKEIIENFNITLQDCEQNSRIWTIHPQSIEHHGLVLLEGGFKNLTASYILNYFKIIRRKIQLLKLHDYMDSETSVINSYLHHLGSPPLNALNLKQLEEDECRMVDVYNEIVKSFLIWRLDTNASEIERVYKTYPRLKHKSLKYMSWTLDVLEHELEFTKEKILRHGYLIHSYPHNTLDTLKRVPVLCGKDIKTVVHRHPKIIMTATNTILSTAQHLKDYGVPDSAAHRCFHVFTLGSDSMQRRLQQMRTVPELRPFADNPRVLQIVHYQRKVNARLDKLQDLQRQCASLHVLTSAESYFERYARDGVDRTRGSDVVTLLSQSLEIQEAWIRDYLGRHPYWCSVSCLSVQNTLDFLRTKYEDNDILSNLHLVLYPSDRVKQILTELLSFEAVKKAQDLARSRYPDKEPKLTKNNELALCLYFLEKDHHFTGNGIWNTV